MLFNTPLRRSFFIFPHGDAATDSTLPWVNDFLWGHLLRWTATNEPWYLPYSSLFLWWCNTSDVDWACRAPARVYKTGCIPPLIWYKSVLLNKAFHLAFFIWFTTCCCNSVSKDDMVHDIMFLNMYSRFWHNKCLFCFYLYSLETTARVPFQVHGDETPTWAAASVRFIGSQNPLTAKQSDWNVFVCLQWKVERSWMTKSSHTTLRNTKFYFIPDETEVCSTLIS